MSSAGGGVDISPAADLAEVALRAIDRRTREIGQSFLERLGRPRPSFWHRRWWDELLVAWTRHDESLQLPLLRFFEVLPQLSSQDAVVQHLEEYLGDVQSRLPWLARAGLSATATAGLTRSALARAARSTARDFARRLIAATSVSELVAAAGRERDAGRGFAVAPLVGAVACDRDAERCFRGLVDLMETVAPQVERWSELPDLDGDPPGSVPRVQLAVRLSNLAGRFDPLDPDAALREAGGRFRELLRAARRYHVLLEVQAELFPRKQLLLSILQQILCDAEFRDVADVGLVIPCCLHDTPLDLRQILSWVEQRGTPLRVRLVKGDFWNADLRRAQAGDWSSPVFTAKWRTDACFEWAVRFVLRHHRQLHPAIGSHHPRSVAHAIAVAEHLKLPPRGLEIQLRYSVAEAEKRALVELGPRVRVTLPYGDLLPGLALLVRQQLDNPASAPLLRVESDDPAVAERLLRDPNEIGLALAAAAHPEVGEGAERAPAVRPGASRQPAVDLAIAANCQALQRALTLRAEKPPRDHPLIIAGRELVTRDTRTVYDASYPERVIGRLAIADREQAAVAIEAAREAAPGWAALSCEQRAAGVRRAATALRARIWESAAWSVAECGMGWRLALREVTAAVNTLDALAAAAEQLGTQPAARGNPRHDARPYGVAAVIPPWNSPLATCAKLTAAALAAGNTVVLQPAARSALTTAQLVAAWGEAQLPAGVFQTVSGDDRDLSGVLVAHAHVPLVAFAGPRATGMELRAAAAQVAHADRRVQKHVLAELDTRSSFLIDADADLEAAVTGVLQSAFGYQGQFRTGCRRAIVLADVHDAFVARLVEVVASLPLGPADLPGMWLGPLIDAAALQAAQELIQFGRREAREVLPVTAVEQRGHFLLPHVFADVPPTGRLAASEVPGPVLAVLRARSFDEAIAMADAAGAEQTVALYSRSPRHLERARRELRAARLHWNGTNHGVPWGAVGVDSQHRAELDGPEPATQYLRQFVASRTLFESSL